MDERVVLNGRTANVQHVGNIALLRLRVPMAAADTVARKLGLPEAQRSSPAAGCIALWIAPDQWLIASESESIQDMTDRWAAELNEVLHLLVDVSAALNCMRLSGSQVRGLLAMGSGLDWSVSSMPPGASTRTRLAQIPAIVHVGGEESIDVYVDRSHRDYFERWIERSISDPLLRERACPNTY